MSRKKEFNQGLEVGIRISEELMKQKVEENYILMSKIERLASTHEGLKEVIQQVLNYNEAEAIEKYYGICVGLSPRDLPEAEKIILLNVLATLYINTDELNQYQKCFFSNLKHYLQLFDYSPDTKYKFENIENVRDLDFQIIILKCIREFLFLRDCDFSFIDEYEELFDVFDIKQKRVRQIDDMIDLTYYLFNESGIIEMYGNHIPINMSESNDEEGNPDIILKKQVVDRKIIIEENEAMYFENQAIFIRANIECKGKIVFQNCQLHYCESNNLCQIIMGSNSYIEFKNCVIRCHGINKDNYDTKKYFMVCNEYGDWNEATFAISNCIFVEASNFLYTQGGRKLYIDKSEFIDSYALFNYMGREAVISNCFISLYKIPSYYETIIENKKNDLGPIFSINDAKYYNCNFEGNEETVCNIDDNNLGCDLIRYASEVNSCKFIKLNNAISSSKIMSCKFEQCKNVYVGNDFRISLSMSRKEKYISDCLFIKCSKILALGKDAVVEKCQFLECFDTLIIAESKSRIISCEFYNITVSNKTDDLRFSWYGMSGIDGTAILLEGQKGHESIEIRNCEFNGIKIGDDAYLIEVSSYVKLDKRIGHIEKCKFINVSNAGGDLFKNSYNYYGLFNKRYTEEGLCWGYMGMPKIMKGNGICEAFSIKEYDTYGKSIGTSDEIGEGISGKVTRYIQQEAFIV